MLSYGLGSAPPVTQVASAVSTNKVRKPQLSLARVSETLRRLSTEMSVRAHPEPNRLHGGQTTAVPEGLDGLEAVMEVHY